MKYKADNKSIQIGDKVLVEGNVAGQVVCDYDARACLSGYEHWLSQEKLADGSTLSTGVMIETKELGFLYYPVQDAGIVHLSGK